MADLPPVDAVLSCLREQGQDTALSRLVDLVVDDLLSRPLAEVVDAEWTAGLLGDALQAWLRNDAAEERLLEALEKGIASLGEDPRRLGEMLPEQVDTALRRLAGRPWHADPRLLRSVLDRPPVRRLVRELLRDALVDFGRKLREPVASNPVGRGLGGLGRFAKDHARQRAGSLGSLAGGLVGAVSEEVERQLQRRADEVADSALSGVLQRLVDQLCDPARAEDQAALRLALLDGLLAITGAEAAGELRRSEPRELAALLRETLSAWTEQEDFVALLTERVEALVAQAEAPTLGVLLDEAQLRDQLVPLTRRLAERRVRPLLESEAFALWLAELLEAAQPD